MHHDSALLTDQYELVMAHGYWHLGMHEQEAVFYLAYRNNPFKGDYTIACGLSDVIRYLSTFHFTDSDIDYLQELTSPDGDALFEPEFLYYLKNIHFQCDVDAIPEGTVLFAQEPMLRIKGPLLQCQILETALINLTNFSTLAATKASRICAAAGKSKVVEFGVRRAQGPNGGLTGSRAAYVGGCDSTSHVLAGKQFGIPIKGTQAHSWIMAFPSELDAFREFAKINKQNTTLLVDTYDTHKGVENAITVGNELRAGGYDLFSIRLDSGDLVALSKEARTMLDEAGFNNTKIMASGDLDEYSIADMRERGAKIDAWGVGTKLSTCYDQPALNMIYKLCAIKSNDEWQYKLKISDQKQKTTRAGIIQVRRYFNQQHIVKDVLYDVDFGINDEHPEHANQTQDLLVPIFRAGKLVYEQPALADIRDHALQQVAALQQSRPVAVELETSLQALQEELTQAHML